jgi:hypothetical protein
MNFRFFLVILTVLSVVLAKAQHHPTLNINDNKFRQLGPADLPTPNVYRTASGAPGHMYWQNEADYDMKIRLDDENQRVYGEEVITYHNNSPDALDYLWVQLDQNMRAKDSDTYKIRTSKLDDRMSTRGLEALTPTFDGGFKLDYVKYGDGQPAKYTVNQTMMRVDLPVALKPGESTKLQIKWWYNINDRMKIGGRSGYEYFEEDDNYLYTIAQFFPRMAVYSDEDGWQNKQFLGRGEFTLPFGDYNVELTVPSDHLIASTGTLQNAKDVLTKKQFDRWEQAQKSYDELVIVATQEEAVAREAKKLTKTRTWKFQAENVRDFGWASSRKFIWDAMAVKQTDGTTVMAMSMYPKEGNPLWEKFSTKAVAHTLKWYSHYTFPYPYPVAWSVHAKSIGMEYPMICFNFGRPESDGTYSERTKYGMIGVIIHEVGHNYFPMIVNSDERQWTWMDEGLNTFLQYLSEQQWERNYPSRRGPADKIVRYMAGDKDNITPIMTNSESIYQFGSNAYGKPATALNILRETVMGREDFDYAFKKYSNRWMFKHPEPADLFRTMEDASAYDLDWFWRGWFFTTDHTDQKLANVRHFQVDSKDPEKEKMAKAKLRDEARENISTIRNREIEKTQDEIDPSIKDFYTTYDPLAVDAKDRADYEKYLSKLTEEERKAIPLNSHFYELTIQNDGGLVMPVILEWTFSDGTTEVDRIPAEIWKTNDQEVTKVFVKDKEVTNIVLDPFLETADIDRSDNYYPSRPAQSSRFELFNRPQRSRPNPMQRANGGAGK